MEYVNIFLIVLFICLFAFFIFNGSSKQFRNRRFSEITVPATLSEKRIQENESMRFGFGVQPDKERYYLTFLTKDEISFEFRVTNTDFYDFEIGTIGKLTYQGSDYKGFESDQT
jgi:hypothetical protein